MNKTTPYYSPAMTRVNGLKKAGFTMIELIVVIAIVGIVSAIAAPFGFGALERYRTTSARDSIHSAMRMAQDKAQQEKRAWRFAIRQKTDGVEWAIYPKDSLATVAEWQTVGTSSLVIDAETTFRNSGGSYYVQFDERGALELWLLGRITVSSRHFPSVKKCVIVSTILGAMRKAEEQPAPEPSYDRSDRFCY